MPYTDPAKNRKVHAESMRRKRFTQRQEKEITLRVAAELAHKTIGRRSKKLTFAEMVEEIARALFDIVEASKGEPTLNFKDRANLVIAALLAMGRISSVMEIEPRLRAIEIEVDRKELHAV